MKNNQDSKKKHGGPRANSGRPKNSVNKLTASTLLDEIQRVTGKKFETLVAEHYLQATLADDKNALRDYDKFIVNKVITDTVDITSQGQSISPTLIFGQVKNDSFDESDKD